MQARGAPAGDKGSFEGDRFLVKDKFIPLGGLQVNVIQGKKGVNMQLQGQPSMDSSPNLRASLGSILQSRPQKSGTIDLSEVLYVDTSGIAPMNEALKVAQNRNSTLQVKAIAGSLLQALEITGNTFRIPAQQSVSETSKATQRNLPY